MLISPAFSMKIVHFWLFSSGHYLWASEVKRGRQRLLSPESSPEAAAPSLVDSRTQKSDRRAADPTSSTSSPDQPSHPTKHWKNTRLELLGQDKSKLGWRDPSVRWLLHLSCSVPPTYPTTPVLLDLVGWLSVIWYFDKRYFHTSQ